MLSVACFPLATFDFLNFALMMHSHYYQRSNSKLSTLRYLFPLLQQHRSGGDHPRNLLRYTARLSKQLLLRHLSAKVLNQHANVIIT